MRKEIVIVSQRDRVIFDEFFLLIAGILGGLGLEPLVRAGLGKLGLSFPWLNVIEVGIAFLIILFVVSHLRKVSDTIK